MSLDTRHQFDVLVIGGGPAGIAAAVRAAEAARVGIVDDNPTVGGQVWRGASDDVPDPDAAEWRERLTTSGVTTLCGMTVFHQPEAGVLLAEANDLLYELRYQKLILATGARERFLPFPGWTLPNVMGAGGLQALVKSGLQSAIRGKRVVVAGTGPLLLAVAAYLRRHGAEIPVVCEQATWTTLSRFGLGLAAYRGKIAQALRLKKALAGIPFAANTWVVEALGTEALESVTISRAGKKESIPCNYLACGFHLVPNTELAQLLGCKLENSAVQVNEFQETTVPGIFCGGEPTGIGGVEQALVEGQIAGLAATGRSGHARKLFAEREKARRFARILDRTFRLRPELKNLPTASTIVCRCEDVPYSHLRQHTSWRAAKLHTRCGMGPCQGRICGPATEFLFNWKPDSVRPPIFPARVESLASISAEHAEPSALSGGRS